VKTTQKLCVKASIKVRKKVGVNTKMQLRLRRNRCEK